MNADYRCGAAAPRLRNGTQEVARRGQLDRLVCASPDGTDSALFAIFTSGGGW